MSEDTPLLAGLSPYDRFSSRAKRLHVDVVAFTAVLPLFVSGSFVPSIPQIAADLNTTGSVISLAVSISVLATALGSLTSASYSTFYGRRPVYLFSLPFLCIGSIGVARSNAVPELLFWRFMQAFGASCGWSLGASVIGDLYKVEERGTAMGVFYSMAMLGPALSPLCGGLASQYASWRHMQYSLGICGLIAFWAVFFFLPETMHPGTLGVDKASSTGSSRRLFWINPFASLTLLRSPNLLLASFAGTTALITDFALLLPLAYTIGQTYGIKNEALIGACFLPSGLGNMVGGIFAGRISDHMVKKWKKRRGGEWVPEDRLRAAIFGSAFLVPVSVLCSGLATQFVGGTPGLVLNLICLFFNGLSLTSVLSTISAYSVDILQSRSAEAVAASNGLRAIFLAFASSAIVPMMENMGPLATDAIAAGLAWFSFVALILTIWYGDRMRNWIDVGYTTTENEK
ncbi:MFS general substrate transporter [Athelia psychrophila]|uniref:MFS general substrate transporter n=1 Tax=Athelia psychrophila TaxID=1759441 RepID=A0A166BTM5_9AGAM|nr:MFS general substrate transporter [Fibularhizoctonia sp. CBS 109695]KZP18382.1 MFS general substrate transporter [Fibularhizoctonia sp. CBS 109695]